MEKNLIFSKPTIELFKSWNDNNVKYCHWKSTDHLEATFLAQTDIDVLIHREYAQKAIEIALDLGFVNLKSSHFRGYPSVTDFVRYDETLNRWVHLHFHVQLICGDRWVKAYHLPFEEIVLKNRVKHPNYDLWIISPQYELLILIYRMNAKFKKNWLLDKKIQKEIDFIKNLGEQYPTELDEKIKEHIGQKSLTLFEDILSGNKILKELRIKELRRAFNVKEFRRMSSIRFFWLSKFRFTYRAYAEIRKRKFKIYASGRRSMPNGGIIIGFLGIDGSGKTTGIKRASKFFASHFNVQCNFLGSGKSGASWSRKLIMNLVGFKAKFKGHKEVRKQNRTAKEDLSKPLKKPPFYYLLWMYLVTRDREKQLNQIQRGLANGKLVFVDRWLQNDIIGGLDGPRLQNYIEYSGFVGKVARREQKLYERIKLIPLHQVVKLNITPEISVERKPGELTLKGAGNAINRLNSLQWPENTVVTDIDATKRIDYVTQSMNYNIWKTIQRYS